MANPAETAQVLMKQLCEGGMLHPRTNPTSTPCTLCVAVYNLLWAPRIGLQAQLAEQAARR